MIGHLNEYLVNTNSIDRHRPHPSAQLHLQPRGLWRARLRRGRQGLLVDTPAIIRSI